METGRHINKTRGGNGGRRGGVQRVGASGEDENVCALSKQTQRALGAATLFRKVLPTLYGAAGLPPMWFATPSNVAQVQSRKDSGKNTSNVMKAVLGSSDSSVDVWQHRPNPHHHAMITQTAQRA